MNFDSFLLGFTLIDEYDVSLHNCLIKCRNFELWCFWVKPAKCLWKCHCWIYDVFVKMSDWVMMVGQLVVCLICLRSVCGNVREELRCFWVMPAKCLWKCLCELISYLVKLGFVFVWGIRWKVVGEETGIQYGPFPVPKGGLPIKVYSRKKEITS